MLIPKENEKDLADVPDKVKKNLEIVPVNTIEEVLVHALLEMPKAINEGANQEKTPKSDAISQESAENKGKDVIHH